MKSNNADFFYIKINKLEDITPELVNEFIKQSDLIEKE